MRRELERIFPPLFGPEFLILAQCALYLYCASYTGQGNRKDPQKGAQSLKISPVLKGSYNPTL